MVKYICKKQSKKSDRMLPEQVKGMLKVCKEFGFKDIYELQKILMDNYDIGLLSSQWPQEEEEMYNQLKTYFCGKD